MTVSGWMLLEAFKPYELTASFNSVTKDLLGHKINQGRRMIILCAS